MRRLYTLGLFLLLFHYSKEIIAQQSVAIGTTTPDPSAVLLLVGNGSQGLIIPVTSNVGGMPTGSSKAGMIVYNSSDKKVYYYDGTNWAPISGGVNGTDSQTLLINGNAISISNGNSQNISGIPPTSVGQVLVWDGSKWTSSSATTPTTNQVLMWNGTTWAPATLSSGGTVTNVTGTAPVTVVTGTTTPAISIAPGGITNALLAANSVNTSTIADGSITATDLNSMGAINSGQVLQWNGTAWAPATLTGGGDMTKLVYDGNNDNIVDAAALLTTTLPLTGGGTGATTAAVARTNLGLGSLSTLSAITSTEITDGAITAADLSSMGAINSGQVLQWNGTAWTAATLAASAGDMTKAIYDTNNDNIADAAASLTTTLPLTGGGTGATTAAVARTNLGLGTLATLSIITSTEITDGTIAAVDINNMSATSGQVLTFNGTNWAPASSSGLSSSLTSANIFVGNGSNIATGVAMSGDAIISNTGALTLSNSTSTRTNLGLGSLATLNAVTNNEITDGSITGNDIALNTIGADRIVPGTNGQVLTTNGGVATWAAGFTNPMTTAGDIIYGGASGTPTRLATGTGFLKGGATPAYSSIDLANTDVTGTLPITNGGTGATTAAAALTSLGGLGTSLTSGNIFVGNSSNLATSVAMSGDANMSNTGALTISNTATTGGNIINAINANGSSAINGARVNPAFGTQNISTTGTLNSGAITATNLASVNTVAYTWPNAQGGANTVLTNNGSGTLSWAAPQSGWSLTGNTGTNPATNFIGTTDLQDLVIKTNNFERIRILAGGQVAIGDTPLSSTGLKLSQVVGGNPSNLGISVTVSGGSSGNTGVYGIASGTGSSGNFGGDFEATGGGSTLGIRATASGGSISNFGIEASASGTAPNNFGVYAHATGGTTNWAGYFDQGNVHITNGLSVGATPGTFGTAGQVLTSQGAGVAPVWSSAGASGWGLTGNSGTSIATNFIGTADNVGLRFKTNNNNSGLIDPVTSNAFFGYLAGNATTGNQNVGIGTNALIATATGAGNVGIGTGALQTNSTGGNNIAIGNFADVSSSSLTNSIAIGANASVGSSNSMVLGGTGSNAVKVGIDTSLPRTDIQIGGTSHLFDFPGATALSYNLYENAGNLFHTVADGASALALESSKAGFYINSSAAADALFSGTMVNRMVLTSTGLSVNKDGPDNSAVLHVVSETTGGGGTPRGFMMPSLITSDRDAIPSPLDGLMIYNETDHEFNYYNGLASAWQKIGDGSTAGNGLTLTGSTLDLGGTMSLTNTVFQGSADNMFNIQSSAAAQNTKAGLHFKMFQSAVGTQYEIFARKSDATANSGQSDLLITKEFSTAGGNIELMKIDNTTNNIVFNGAKTTASSYGNVVIPNGNVGIGTATPSGTAQLHVLAPSGNLRARFETGGGTLGPYLSLTHSGGREYIIGSTGSGNGVGANKFEIQDATLSQTRLVIDPNGQVGIGITSPSAKLDVIGGDINTNGEIHRTATGSANMVPIAYGSVNSSGTIQASSGNISVNVIGFGDHEIVISGESYSDNGYITTVTLTQSGTGGSQNFHWTRANGTNLRITVVNDSSGSPSGVWTGYHFVVYKP